MSRLAQARLMLEARYRESLAQEATDLAALGGDWLQIGAMVHRIKGSGGSFGFPMITAAALAVEQASICERPGALADLIDELMRRYFAVPEHAQSR